MRNFLNVNLTALPAGTLMMERDEKKKRKIEEHGNNVTSRGAKLDRNLHETNKQTNKNGCSVSSHLD